MARSVLLEPADRRELLEIVLEEGVGPKAVAKVARRFRCSGVSLARWIVGLGGPHATDRDTIAAMLRRRARERSRAVESAR